MEYCGEHKELSKNVDRLMQWKNGNGAKGAEERLQFLENNAVTSGHLKVSVSNIVRSTVKEMQGEHRADWNKWINTLLLLVTAISVFVGFWGGG